MIINEQQKINDWLRPRTLELQQACLRLSLLFDDIHFQEEAKWFGELSDRLKIPHERNNRILRRETEGIRTEEGLLPEGDRDFIEEELKDW